MVSTSSQQKMGQSLDGKMVAKALQTTLAQDIAKLKHQYPQAPPPKLVVVLVGEDPASQVYTKRKAKVAESIGMASELIVLDANTSQEVLLNTLEKLNQDNTVHGILVQMPLPKHLNEQAVLATVDPRKDVDGFHPINLGRLLCGDTPAALPCTPDGVMTLLKHYKISPKGKKAVVVGRSTIVGKPMGLLLLNANATVTTCHSHTKNLMEICQSADILVAAVGVPHMIKATHIKPGAVVIDVGINRQGDGRLVGDVDFDAVKDSVSYITPVPGGVGPMTIATLMQNTLALYRQGLRTV